LQVAIGGDYPSFPTDPNNYIVIPMSADVEPGTVASIPMNGYNVFTDLGKRWIPGQWAPAARTYYVHILDSAAARPYKIMNNTENSLILDTEGYTLPLPASSVGKGYVI